MQFLVWYLFTDREDQEEYDLLERNRLRLTSRRSKIRRGRDGENWNLDDIELELDVIKERQRELRPLGERMTMQRPPLLHRRVRVIEFD